MAAMQGVLLFWVALCAAAVVLAEDSTMEVADAGQSAHPPSIHFDAQGRPDSWPSALVEEEEGPNCATKHKAGHAVCHVYGAQSLLCSDAQQEYKLQCSMNPRPEYTPELGEALNLEAEAGLADAEAETSRASTTPYSSTASGELIVPKAKTLEEELTPALSLCKVTFDQAKLTCQTAVANQYSKWKKEKADGPATAGDTSTATSYSSASGAQELGEHGEHKLTHSQSKVQNVEKLYEEALGAMHRSQAKEFEALLNPIDE